MDKTIWDALNHKFIKVGLIIESFKSLNIYIDLLGYSGC